MSAMESLEFLSNRTAMDSLTELTYRQGDNPTASESFCENSCGPRPIAAARAYTLKPDSMCSSMKPHIFFSSVSLNARVEIVRGELSA